MLSPNLKMCLVLSYFPHQYKLKPPVFSPNFPPQKQISTGMHSKNCLVMSKSKTASKAADFFTCTSTRALFYWYQYEGTFLLVPVRGRFFTCTSTRALFYLYQYEGAFLLVPVQGCFFTCTSMRVLFYFGMLDTANMK